MRMAAAPFRRRSRRPRVEGLESRFLLSATINEFPVPTTASEPTGITAGPDGNLWFVESASSQIAEINPTTHAITEFPVPELGGRLAGITTGHDGNLWFTDRLDGLIGQFKITSHAIAEFPIPTTGGQPSAIVAGPDGNLWFTELAGNKIGEINPTTDAINEFSIPTGGSAPLSITAGPDGNLWFTESTSNKIGEINPTTHAIIEFSVPTINSVLFGIAAGPDGNLWFSESSGNKVGEISPSTHAIGEFAVPTAGSQPSGIAAGSDGNLWFTENTGNKIGAINPTTHAIVEFPIPTPLSTSLNIVRGPDGNLWFTETQGNKIAQVVPTATLTAPDLALLATGPATVTLGNSVTYTFTVNNVGTANATGVTVTDTLPGNVVFVAATGGVTPTGGILTFALGSLAAGGRASFTITIIPTAAGMLINRASASANESDPTPADNQVTLITTVVPPATDGPIILGVRVVARRKRPPSVVLTFDKPLDPGRAQSLAEYHINTLTRSRRSIPIKAALYDKATLTVTLRSTRRLKRGGRYRLIVIGVAPAGVTDLLGNLLDGQNSGHPGTNFVETFTA
jgi:uncharacterized repeat protein (TIGR01451 family)